MAGQLALGKFRALLSRAGPVHGSPLTLGSPRPVPEPVPRGAGGSMPAGVPGGPEPLPQLPEMPEPSLGESHSPYLPQPQVGRHGQGRVGAPSPSAQHPECPSQCPENEGNTGLPCLGSEPHTFLPSTAETSCHRCHPTSASCP